MTQPELSETKLSNPHFRIIATTNPAFFADVVQPIGKYWKLIVTGSEGILENTGAIRIDLYTSLVLFSTASAFCPVFVVPLISGDN